MQVGLTFNENPKILYYTTDQKWDAKTNIVVNTSRGLELAKVVGFRDGTAVEELRFVRIATDEDIARAKQNVIDAEAAMPKVKEEIEKFGLNMKLGVLEYTLNKEKLIINYTADTRIDFRELVKNLVSKLKVRIEMHQVGNRDQVQQMGAIGPCGRVCCCKAHLNDFDKVTIKMAKNQGLSLNPVKLNGMCGKLLCCLKYEDEYYSQTLAKMPKISQRVVTPDGEGETKSLDVLREQVEVVFTRGDEVERKVYDLADIKFSKIKGKNG